MRFNKRKLAALMMSAVMAASTMSTVAFAEEVDVTAVEAVEEVAEAQAEIREVTGVDITKDGKVTVTYSDGTTSNDFTATSKTTKGDCVTADKLVWTVVVEGKTWSEEYETSTPAGQHTEGKTVTVTKKAPTCKEEGTKVTSKVCSVCGKEYDPTEESIPATGEHVADEPESSYEVKVDWNTEKDENGLPKLINDKLDGTYTETITTKCKVCGDVIKTEGPTEKTLYGDVQVKGRKLANAEDGNIKTDVSNISPKTVDDSELLLKDCTKDGYYYIVSYADESCTKEISREKHTVAAHHVTTLSYEAKDTKEDELLVDVVDKKTGAVTGATNQSCYKSIEGYEIVTCVAEGKELSRTLKTFEPEGPHILNDANTNADGAVKTLIAEAKARGYFTVENYETLKAGEKTYGIKVSAENTCESDGTLTVTPICTVCEKPATATTLTVKKLGHLYGEEVVENKVEATCGKAGSYDVVQYCEVCGDRKEIRTGVEIPALPHSFVDPKTDAVDETNAYIGFSGAVVVDQNGYHLNQVNDDFNPNACYGDFTVKASVLVKCDTCGKAVDLKDVNGTVVTSLKVASVEKQSDVNAGSITLKATYTKTIKETGRKEKMTEEYTVPYYSNIAAYLERNPISGLHQDADGIFRYYKDGVLQKDYTGVVRYDGGEFFVANGVLCREANGLNRNAADGKWYFLANGQIQRGYNGLALYDGEWFYLINGELDTSVKGLVPYDGGQFLFAAGRLVREHNGLWRDFDGTWYFLARGQVQSQFTGTATYQGQKFNVVAGKVIL